MATSEALRQLEETQKRISSVDMEKLKRPSLGQESLAKDIESRETKIQQLMDLAKGYAPLVHDGVVNDISSTLEAIAQAMTAQAELGSPEYLASRDNFLNELDSHIEESNRWKPLVAGAAMLERGLLEDEGLRRENERALATLRQNTEETLERIQSAAKGIDSRSQGVG